MNIILMTYDLELRSYEISVKLHYVGTLLFSQFSEKSKSKIQLVLSQNITKMCPLHNI